MAETETEQKPAPKEIKDVDNIHDAKALMKQRLAEKYVKVVTETGRYKETLKLQEEERLYQKKLRESGAVGMSPADKAALDASVEYEAAVRAVDQFNPDQKESLDVAKEILGEDFSKLKTDKILEGMGPVKGKVTAKT